MTASLLALLLVAPGSARVSVVPRVNPSISAMPRLPHIVALDGVHAGVPSVASSLTPSLLTRLNIAPTPAFPVAPAPPDAAAPLGVDFDGAARHADAPASPADVSTWLDVGDARVALAVQEAADLAARTKIGRRVLEEAAKLLGADPLGVDALDLGKNHGEFDYLDRRLRLHRKLLRPESRAQLAATLVHELRHVVQHSQGVPAEALEMEIEAHLDDLALMRELGVEPPPKTFARQLADALKEGPARFVEVLSWALPGRPRLATMDFDEMESDLEDQLEAAQRGKSARKRKLAAAIERDLLLVRTAEGRASYAAFARRVEARLKREAAAAAAR